MAHSIGKTIAELRKAKGWTQIELAEKLQVSDKTISKWEKDSGAPSIEFFPALAELFGVSIDYLMTGKETEPEIITMSKAELCAKNDDVSLAKEINVQTTDENGKSLIDYIIQYKSYKVFAEICEKIDSVKFGVDRYIEYALITNQIEAIQGIKENYVHIEDKSYFEKKEGVKPLCLITDKLLDIIVLDKRVNNDTIDYLLSNQKDRQCVWYLVFPYLLHQSYLHNNMELFNMILNASISNNQYAYDKMPIKHDSYYGYNYDLRYFMITSKNGYVNKVHGLVRALEKTIKLALERSDIETIEKLNNLNSAVMKYYSQFKCYVANADEIRIAKLKLDKTISPAELAIQSTIHDGIVNIDELLAIKDFKTIKTTLDKYPICEFEKRYLTIKNAKQLLAVQNWTELYKFAVEKNSKKLIKVVQEKNIELCEKVLENLCRNLTDFPYSHTLPGRSYNGINSKYLRLRKSPNIYFNANCSYLDVLDYVLSCRKQFLDDCANLYDKEAKIADLTREYFITELEKGNTEIVIVKLCVRLEAILRCDYHYEGDFAEMLNEYCSRNGQEDDGWGYNVDAEFVKYLFKLRKCRNNIVHSEKSNEEMSIAEIKYCIDYICKMG